MIVFKLFKTPKNCYVFDRNRNKILRISEEDFNELDLLNQNQVELEEVSCLAKYQKRGFLKESVLEEVVHPETKYIQYYLNHKVRMIVLQITQRCNLRCDYCAYSGIYENRSHSDKDMTLDTAKESIDYLFKHSDEVEKAVIIGFYGGEPLLRFDFIKECIQYIEQNYAERKVQYTMTTNGTLLTIEKVKYLMEHKFGITISLDGSRESHNANRKFINGQGSFDIIMDNIKKIYEYDADIIKKLRFNTVLNPKVDYGSVSNYFATEDIISQADVALTYMQKLHCKEDIIFGDEFINENRYSFLKTMLIMLNKLKGATIPNYAVGVKRMMDKDYELLSKKELCMGKKCHHSGPCIPGSTRMFITVNRQIFSCEKASDTSVGMNIGNLDDGIDIDKVINMMNIGKLSEDNCKKCWAFTWCIVCAICAEEKKQLASSAILHNCGQSKRDAEEKLINICVMKEFGYQFEKEELYV